MIVFRIIGNEYDRTDHVLYDLPANKSQDLGCTENIIHFFIHHGLTEQEAYHKAQVMLRELYRKWYATMVELPVYGEQVDRRMYEFIDGLQDVARANCNWR